MAPIAWPRNGEVFGLQLRLDARWETMYQFTLAAQTRVDCEVGNWFTSTHPHSLTQNLIVCRAVGETRVNLVNSNRSVRHPDGHVEPSALADARELGKLPEEVMNLALPKPAETIWAKVPKQPFPA
jgi:N-hydroxyarylamine O-acetyltransferase